MRVFFDTEFIEDGKTIDLISIGMVREDGAELYLVSAEFDANKANDWVKQNVLSKLGGFPRSSRHEIKESILDFVGEAPEFWAYYSDYDWVVLCQLYGTMMQLPGSWPMFCLDLKQVLFGMGNPKVPKLPESSAHNALIDARWVASTFKKFVKTQLVAAGILETGLRQALKHATDEILWRVPQQSPPEDLAQQVFDKAKAALQLEPSQAAVAAMAMEASSVVDDALLNFVRKMEVQLKRNEHRGDWKDVDPGICIEGVKKNLGELGDYPYNLTSIVDIANFALMLAVGRHIAANPKPVNGGNQGLEG